ncbi:aminotransferase class IV [Emticicia sp. SJ17W-69]|uniref:aminotransferase class IV n=1 Tax=Emticicia sp. SJ17W-69 TaxID=3421657 RepID=UPI003EB7EAC5
MSLLFETIKCQNRQLHNLSYHDNRVRWSRENLFGMSHDFDFANTIKIPDWIGEGIYRCRVSYGEEIEKVEFFAYEFKHPKVLQLDEYPSFNYEFKYEDRGKFQNLLKIYPNADDVIITQNDLITDATYANIALFDGTKWFTPNTFLLLGTKREYLLDNQLLTEDEIKVSDLKKFKKIALINAMRDLDLAYDFEVDKNIISIKLNNGIA